MQTKDDEEKVELEDDSDCLENEEQHQVRPLQLTKGQLKAYVESSKEDEVETEVQLVATMGT